ncbi:MAG: SIMPL domain-containing protein [Gemmatimonas sp.]|uniref:SIMPL domain-containing protein n=1 Tax=Gemmatimonas sp. TaxID=1962908 RepID=UPI00391A36B0
MTTVARPIPRTPLLLGALVLAVGMAGAGALIGTGFARMRTADRTVAVKGVAEREAKADLAIWPLRLVATDDDLGRANTALERNVQQVRAFLRENGLDSTAAEITVQEFRVEDARTVGGYANTARYIIRQTLVVRSADVDKVQAASQRVPELVRNGVVLSSGQEYGGGGPTFVFTGLNTLKPAMIAEATARARQGAEQFARDANSTLSGIRTASQGVFEILPRDQAAGITEESQVRKRVRVVTTVVYGLDD